MSGIPTLEADLAARVSGPGLMQHVREIVRWPRHAGTPEEREAFGYLERVLDGYGYRTRLHVHDAYISLPVSARVEWNGRTLRALAHSFSRSGAVEGPLVHGAPGGECPGVVLLLDGIASPRAARDASRSRALAQVHVSPHEHLHDMCVSPVWGSPTDEQLADLPTTVVVSVDRDAGAALRAALARSPQRVRVVAEVDTRWRRTPILQADLAGRDPGRWLMFSGHYDSWYLGAMDNGGANATMLEVARLCALHRDRWERGLRLLFWSGHSQGRYSSSAWYADAFREEIDAGCVGHVNVDSTGGAGNTVVADAPAMAEAGPLARAVLAEFAGQEWSGRRPQRAGDQAFWGIGVSCLFANLSEQPARPGDVNASAAVFGTDARRGAGTGWWWHTPDDTLDKMDEALLVRDTRIYLAAVWRWITEPVLPLDFHAAATDVRATLEGLQAAAGPRLDLGPCLERARRLEALTARLRDATRRDAVNECLIRLQRTLVPMDYTRADPFEQDPALPVPRLSGLEAARALAGLDADGAAARHLTVRLLRARNRVAAALARAIGHVEAAL